LLFYIYIFNFNNFMNDILSLWETLTFFGSLKGNIDIIGSLEEH
jgi:hypothetical protein